MSVAQGKGRRMAEYLFTKDELRALTPASYTGVAAQLARALPAG